MQLPDLNLLPALDALLREGSVARAAERMNISASAMSRTLTRLRRVTGDELLAPAGRGLVLTERARQLQPAVERALADALSALRPVPPKDLASIEAVLTLRSSPDVHMLFLPPLERRLRVEAPRVQLRLLPEGDDDPTVLRHDDIDLDLGHYGALPADIRSKRLGVERMVALLHRDHPLAAGPMTLEAFAAAEQLTVSRRGRLQDVLDRALQEQGLARTVRATTSTSWAAALTVLNGGALAILPSRVAAHYAEVLPVVYRPIPLELPTVEFAMAWHRRNDDVPVHGWLRAAVVTIVDDLLSP
ncbi:LysR family transcriptional regulator [Kribbella solani]|uniref:DNA-binding transcriptional LysR family regulator n=1 Tax=Kribbella solani TaxID=236067 RepID=A0A841DRD4_9ACTN|nr:LysR family transcriptional regulator [Kribbella solani]MBB5980459.1 DNA-binding transcriptional LysR family regulator [Kribbella solani]